MPSTYTHYRFGCDVSENVSGSIRQIIRKHQKEYDIGLHGPDLLFYYHPALSNSVNRAADVCHDMTGHDFFLPAAETAVRSSHQDAAVAYLYGVVCHYALDSICHPYVETYIQTGNATHTEIETSFDRALLLRDHLDPMHHPLCGHIHPSHASAELIAGFYPAAKPVHIYQSMRSMIFYNRLLAVPQKAVRKVILSAMRLSSRYEEAKGLLLPDQQNPRTVESDCSMYGLYQKAIRRAGDLLRQMEQHLSSGSGLGRAYDHTFGAL